jgi:HD-GYP domain-containing protein (c-di-GMP phosphodiesterase class II)
VCDAFDAMVSERPYSSAMTPEQAVAELRRCGGSQFDPRIVELFAEAVSESAGRAAQAQLVAQSSG